MYTAHSQMNDAGVSCIIFCLPYPSSTMKYLVPVTSALLLLASCGENEQPSFKSTIAEETNAGTTSAVAASDATSNSPAAQTSPPAPDEALTKAEAALQSDDLATAKVYLLNAIGRNPSDAQLYSKVAALRKNNPGLMTAPEFAAILNVALYQVAPDAVDGVMKMLQEVQDEQQTVAQAPSPAQQEPDYKKRLLELSAEYILKATPEKQLELCKERSDILAILGEIDNKGVDVPKENRVTATLLSFISIKNNLTSVFGNVQAATQDDNACLPMLEKMLNAANGELTQAAYLDYSLLPAGSRVELMDMAKKAEELEKELARAREEPVMEQIRGYYAIDYGNYTARIKSHRQIIERISELVAQVHTPENLAEARKKLQTLAEEVSYLTGERYLEYQKFAVGRIRYVYVTYLDNSYVTDEDAFRYIEGLAEIQLSLLAPEVVSMYQDILPKLLKQLDTAKRKVEAEKCLSVGEYFNEELGETKYKTKKTLEDF